MVQALAFSFWSWFTLISAALCVLVALLAYLSRFKSPATFQVVHFLRGADAKRMFTLLVSDGFLIAALPGSEFRESQRLTLHEVRKMMLAMFHDMGILIAWCNGSLRRELVEKPWEKDGEVSEDSHEFVAGHRALLAAACALRWYALASALKITFVLIFCGHSWLPTPLPQLGRLMRVRKADLVTLYGRVFKSVAEVTVLYDEELPEVFLGALFKLDEPAKDIALWKAFGEPLPL